MALSKKETEKITIKRFKDQSLNFWAGFSHYYLDENKEIQWAAGAVDNEESREILKKYLKRNKLI